MLVICLDIRWYCITADCDDDVTQWHCLSVSNSGVGAMATEKQTVEE